MEVQHIHLYLSAVGQELFRGLDYTIENLSDRRGLKVNLLTKWVDFTKATSPASLLLHTVMYEGYPEKVLPYPVVVATVFRIPTLLPSDQMIYANRTQVLRIHGTNLKKLERISPAYSRKQNSCAGYWGSNVITSKFPLQHDFFTLENFEDFRSFSNNGNNELRVYGICSEMGFLKLGGDDGILVARFHSYN